MNPYYTDYGEYIGRLFPDFKVQKLSVNAGFSCPNRDGTIAYGGCIYCDNSSFTPRYTDPRRSVRTQIEDGRLFFGRKYPDMRYLAYFQSFTNTHAPVSRLRELYYEALDCPGIVGLVIGTRPDCLPEKTLALLGELAEHTHVTVEIGAETSHDRTLREINRRHLWSDVEKSVLALHERGVHTGLHLICGLPGETEEDILTTVDRAAALPTDTLKFHQLQIVRGTELARRQSLDPDYVRVYDMDEYLRLCVRIIERVPRRIAIERFTSQSPADMLIAPRWGVKNHVFTDRLLSMLSKRDKE